MRGSHLACLDQSSDNRQFTVRSSFLHDHTLTYLVDFGKIPVTGHKCLCPLSTANTLHASSAVTLGIHSLIAICCGHNPSQVPQATQALERCASVRKT